LKRLKNNVEKSRQALSRERVQLAQAADNLYKAVESIEGILLDYIHRPHPQTNLEKWPDGEYFHAIMLELRNDRFEQAAYALLELTDDVVGAMAEYREFLHALEDGVDPSEVGEGFYARVESDLNLVLEYLERYVIAELVYAEKLLGEIDDMMSEGTLPDFLGDDLLEIANKSVVRDRHSALKIAMEAKERIAQHLDDMPQKIGRYL